MNLNKKICIIGHGRHGKDLMAEILLENFYITFDSSSRICAEKFLFDILKDKYDYKTVDECFNDRYNHREEWYKKIQSFCTPDKTRLVKLILSKNDIYVGIRDKAELLPSKYLFDLIIWVDASERIKQEDSSSISVTKEMADIIITNNGTIQEFEKKVIKFGSIIYGKNSNFIITYFYYDGDGNLIESFYDVVLSLVVAVNKCKSNNEKNKTNDIIYLPEDVTPEDENDSEIELLKSGNKGYWKIYEITK